MCVVLFIAYDVMDMTETLIQNIISSQVFHDISMQNGDILNCLTLLA